ncbi:polysialyltransferase family glycosyltransferase [Vogesella amnigena]|uniref:Polysialyltransferase family glycosyltransferase n=1 Tax=Vogesella amnigena TaxID=1507449 RepID=A0ABV7TUA8_9NEIS
MSTTVFVALNEYQYWVSNAVARKQQIRNPVFILMGDWTPIKCVSECHRMPYTDMRKGKLLKLLQLLMCKYSSVDAATIYIPSNLDPYINKLVRKLRPQNVHVFDEGGGAVYSYMPLKKWYTPLVLLGLTDRRWGEGKRVGSIFTPNPEIYSSNFTKELIDIAPEMRIVAMELYMSTFEQVRRDSICGVVVLTQPYPADYLGPQEDGNAALLKFAVEGWECIFVKAHPRELPALEDQGKFKTLPAALQCIPIQAIAMEFPIDSIVSNCSSALLNTSKISGRSVKSYSLIGRVSHTKLTIPFISAAGKIKDLVLV